MAPSEAVWADSDVLLDWLAGCDPWDAAAVELVERGIEGDWDIWFSSLSLANIFYVYRKQAGAIRALVAIETLTRIGNIAPLDATHIERALADKRLDFEDEIQLACAASVPGVGAIITRNLADYRHGPLPAMTAEAWLERHPRATP